MERNILLLYMPAADQKMLPFPPLGISVLSGYLRRAGITANIDDLEIKYWDRDIIELKFLKILLRKLPLLKYNNPKKIFLDKEKIGEYLDKNIRHEKIEKVLAEWESLLDISINKVGYVGFSIMGLSQLITSLCFAKYLKRRYGVKIVFGGSFIAKRMAILVEKYNFVDYLIIGEGEIPLFRLLSGHSENEIDNLVFKRGQQVTINSINSVYPDNMEPDFEGLPFMLYRKNNILLMPYETSRGCRNKCAFCITRRKNLYIKKPEVIIQEIKKIKERHKASCFIFIDNAINIDRDFSAELCAKIIQNKLNIDWSAYYIPEDADEAYFRLLKSAGCIQLRWGIEMLGERVLKEMNKKINETAVSKALNKSHRAGIWNHLIFMVGHPGENWSDIFHLVSFINRNKKYFRSALVTPLDIGRVDILDDAENHYEDLCTSDNSEDKGMFGIKYWELKYRRYGLRADLIKFLLKSIGIRYLSNFIERKEHFEKYQFIYRAFAGHIKNFGRTLNCSEESLPCAE